MEKHLQIDQVVKEGTPVITILEGKAPEQHNPQPVSINANITAPAMFIEKRKETYDFNKSHCLVSKTDGTIQLVINEQSVTEKYAITGKIELGKQFTKLGINDFNKSYSPMELSQRFRLMRSIFPSKKEHLNIVTTLRKLEATITRQVEEADDTRGNTAKVFKQTVASNMPESFNLNIPVIEGQPATNIEVSVILEADGNEIKCFLESVDAAELADKLRTELVEKEVEKIKDFTTVFYV